MIKRYNIKHDGIYYEAFYKCEDVDPYLIVWHRLDENPEDLPEYVASIDGWFTDFVLIEGKDETERELAYYHQCGKWFNRDGNDLFFDVIKWAYIPTGKETQ